MRILPLNLNTNITIPQNKIYFCARPFKKQNKDSFDKNLDALIDKRIKELQQRGVGYNDIVKIGVLYEHQYQKLLFLLDKGVDSKDIGNFIGIDDEKCIKLVKLLKAGIASSQADTILQFSEKQFQVALMLIKSGATVEGVTYFALDYNKEKREEIIDLIKQGVPFQIAKDCATLKSKKELFENFVNLGYDKLTSSIFTHSNDIQNSDEKTQKSCADLIQSIRKHSKKSYDFPNRFIDFIKENFKYDGDLEDFNKYVNSINFDELFKTAPVMKKYSDTELLDFLETHYMRDCSDFSKEDLTFNNLSEFLSQNYINAITLDKLLNSYPLTSRNIGEIPADWLDKVRDKTKAQKEIYEAIFAFQHHKDEKSLADDLTRILNKKTNVKKLNSGAFGTGYKIEIENAITTALKIFKPKNYTYGKSWHGRNIEPQVALLVNNNSDKFVKMYFGCVCSKMQRDGFIVTQFLDNQTAAEQTHPSEKRKYKIELHDYNENNLIKGKIIDFGAIEVTENC